ncbi:MAG TPA: acetyl-CoA carboxylase carboxyltransferase subunit alpha [bacterium]|nr:acetyl-CoA carboxylase carboxyltransferase subunit alpha [bacterium]
MRRALDFERPLVELQSKIEEMTRYASERGIDLSTEISAMKEKLQEVEKSIFSQLTPWQRIQLARHPDRPYFLDYITRMTTDFFELHGDRCYRDDAAIVGGLACLDGRPIVALGHQKGRDTKENLKRNFGMAHPEGFRKALRLMQLAERFGLPVLTFIDSSGAYPGVGAEERGQALIIAENLLGMAALNTPIIVVVTGEGGSGGALAIGVGDRVIMLEHAYYAVCTPEACAAIIWKDRTKAAEAVESMKILSGDLHRLGIIDEILPEPMGAAHRDYDRMAETIKQAVLRNLAELDQIPKEDLSRKRYEKFRRMGIFEKTS